MNVLDRSVAEQLTRVPAGPTVGELRRRARSRRVRRMRVSLAFVVILIGASVIGASLRSTPARRVQVVAPGPTSAPTTSTATSTPATSSTLPLATPAEFPNLAHMSETVRSAVHSEFRPVAGVGYPTSAEIVATTDAGLFPLWGGTTDDKRVYFVQVVGNFVCDGCSRPSNAVASPHGRALHFAFDAAGNGFAFGLAPAPWDLTELGTVYRLPL